MRAWDCLRPSPPRSPLGGATPGRARPSAAGAGPPPGRWAFPEGRVRAGWSLPGTWERCGGSVRDWAGGEGRDDPREGDGGTGRGVVAG